MHKLSKSGLLYFLTFILACYATIAPAAISTSESNAVLISSSLADALPQITSGNQFNHPDLPPSSPAEEEEFFEEIDEDVNESADNHFAGTLALFHTNLARANLSSVFNPESCCGFKSTKTPYYILFHCWKTYLV